MKWALRNQPASVEGLGPSWQGCWAESERATSSRNSKPFHGCPEQELMSSVGGWVVTVAGASGTGEEWVWLQQEEE